MRILVAEHHLQPAIGVRATLIAIGVLVFGLVAAGCTSSKCFPDCVAGYEPVPDACTCRPIADAAVDAGSDARTAPKRVFHLLNGALGAIRDANDTRTGLEVADADCTSAGQMHGGGQWRAWLSSSSANAIDRLVDVGPWYRLDQQTKLFESRAAIAQGPLVPIEDPTDAGVGRRYRAPRLLPR